MIKLDDLPTINPRLLGNGLRAIRKQCGLKQADVAHQLGVVRTTLVAIEYGNRRIKQAEFTKLADIYGRDPAILLDEILGLPLIPHQQPQFYLTHPNTQDQADWIALQHESMRDY